MVEKTDSRFQCHYACAQEYSDPYDVHLHHHQAPFTSVGLFELAPLLKSPASSCTSRLSLHSSNSESSPGPSKDSDDAMSSTQATPPPEPPMGLPVRPQSAETPVRPPGPRRPFSAPALGRRAPKPRRTVQPLACFFCRRRKIACGPPVNLGSGDRTCEYVRPFVPFTLFLSLRTIICAQLRAHVSITGVSRALFTFYLGSAYFSVADGSRVLYWLGHVHGEDSCVSIRKSHTVAAVLLGQPPPLGNHSGTERMRRRRVWECVFIAVNTICYILDTGIDAVISQQTRCPEWFKQDYSFRVAVVPPFLRRVVQ
jgi:hypothetical protein